MYKETLKTMYQMILYKLGLVLRSEYDDIIAKYQKLQLKTHNGHRLSKDEVIADAEKLFEPIEKW